MTKPPHYEVALLRVNQFTVVSRPERYRAEEGRQKRKLRNLKSSGGTQGKGFSCVMAVLVAAMLILAAKTAYDYWNHWKVPFNDANAKAYSAGRSAPFCTFEGVWHDWERDETITLGCLEVKGNIREGSYRSAMGHRATSNFSMSGTYDIDSNSSIHVIGKDGEGKNVKFTAFISVEDVEFPTQMILVDEEGEKGFFIWKRKE
jgi:hypothetical protein